MTIEQFIKKAIEGGWKPKDAEMQKVSSFKVEDGLLTLYGLENKTQRKVESYLVEQIFIDPFAWKAVGKVEGWDIGKTIDPTYHFAPESMWMWQWKMHRMIDALAEGKSLEEFISTL